MTISEKLRSMSDEELASMISLIYADTYVVLDADVPTIDWLEWLKKEYEERET